MVRDRTAPVPLAATTREFGLPAALWAAAQQTGVWDLLQSLWPTPRSRPSPAHYLLLRRPSTAGRDGSIPSPGTNCLPFS